MFLKKLGKKLHDGKKLGKKLSGDIGKIGKKGGRAIETAGKVASVIGAVTGQPEIAGAGLSMIGIGKTSQIAGQGLRDVSKGKLEKASKSVVSLAQA